jgi:lipopolysaccharide assembly outer membrane protein LptD (OstA)
MLDKQYLGDGVYAARSGYDLVLTKSVASTCPMCTEKLLSCVSWDMRLRKCIS